MIATMALFFAQAQPVTAVLSLGEWLALIASGMGVGGLIWRTATTAAKMSQIEGITTRELVRINERLDVIEAFVGDARKSELNDVRWATQTTTRLDEFDRWRGAIDEERRHGPPGRRDADAT